MRTYSNICDKIIICPCVFACELENNKFYVSISSNVNQSIARFIDSTKAPKWIKLYPYIKIIEIQTEGSLIALQNMTDRYIKNEGIENVRSTIRFRINQDN